ncbi:hypothetical protein SAMN05216251_12081 [Actinacidiphila alni]|uniref:Uncharacterized protein n=1 Tax=Actinacidiphila alni TaxID=380248 RepID=A0A1I2JYS1_9ACTN|nr:Vms1/Ankzf1 family peptidyl-tRNA hydrolase [Actinacidiphila alni]SFF59060.1 hypothetical protein SAMN05216251_12081 [Actinacidiphila alni]
MNMDPLRPLTTRSGPWASAYVAGGHTDESGAKERELEVRDVCRALRRDGADPATVGAVRDVLEAVTPAESPYGSAVFAAAGQVVLLLHLAVPPRRPGAHWSALPRLAPLLDAYAADVPCLLARIDRTGADLELRDFVSRHVGRVRGQRWPVHRTGRNDWSERHFQLKVENTWEHNAGQIAEALTTAVKECEPAVLVLAGDPREREAVLGRLPADVRGITASSDHGGRAAGADSAPLERDIDAARQEHLRRHREQVLDRFRAGRVTSDRPTDAVEGVPAAVEAAREHRIATLLLRQDTPALHEEVWTGAEPDRIAVRKSADEPTAARADDALLRAAVATSADVLLLPAAESGEGESTDDATSGADDIPVGGLGALLRWPDGDAAPDREGSAP